jgi:hypothetical protein
MNANMINIEQNNYIIQINPHNFKLKDMIKLQKKIIEQYDINMFLKCCYCSIMGNPKKLNEQQYEYYLHELYDDYPIY